MTTEKKERRQHKHTEYNRLRSILVNPKDATSPRLYSKGKCRQMIQEIK
jgi:hypothetical protein